MRLDDYPKEYPPDSNVSEVAEKLFQKHYLHPLGDDIRFVRLASVYRAKCHECVLMFFWQKCICEIVAVMVLSRRQLQHLISKLY